VPEQFYLRSAPEMKALFAEIPEAVQNTLEVAEKCNVEFDFKSLHYPVFAPPEHFTREGHLRHLLVEGLARRYTIQAPLEGREFRVEGITDPTRLPTYSADPPIAPVAAPADADAGAPGPASVSASTARLEEAPVQAAVQDVMNRLQSELNVIEKTGFI